MKITETYPKGGADKMWEPLHLEVIGLDLPGITIQGRTWGRDGAEITIFYGQDQINNHNYDYHRSLGYQNDMARDAAEDINLIFEINEISAVVSAEQLLPIMKQVRDKCESRFGNSLPDSDYEVLVSFCKMREITPIGLKMLLAANLYGITLFDILDGMDFQTEPNGSIKKHVIDNLKTMLKVAIKQQLKDDSPYVGKTKNALRSLLDYGSSEVSDRMEEFLKELGSASQIIMSRDTYSDLPPYLFKPSDKSCNLKKLGDTLRFMLNQIVQKE